MDSSSLSEGRWRDTLGGGTLLLWVPFLNVAQANAGCLRWELIGLKLFPSWEFFLTERGRDLIDSDGVLCNCG